MSLGTKIREIRLAKGMTQSELGAGLVTPSMISQIESDKANPSFNVLESIATKLETPIEYFLTDILNQLEEKTIHQVGQALLSSGQYAKALETLEALYNRPSLSSAVDHEQLTLDLGKAYLCVQRHDDAFATFEGCLEVADQNGIADIALHALNFLGVVEKERRRYHSALYYWRTAYERLEHLKETDPFIQSQILINLGTIHQELSEFQESSYYLNKAYEFLKNSRDYKLVGDIYLGLGINCMNQQDYKLALEYTQYANAMFESIRHVKLSIDTKKQCAMLMGEHGDLEAAIRMLEQCFREYSRHNYPIDAAVVRGEVAVFRLRGQQFEEAKKECERALADLNHEQVETATVLRVLSKIEAAFGNLELAIQHAENAKELFEMHGVLNEVVETLSVLDGLYEKQGDLRKAMDCARNMKQLLEQMLHGRGIVL